MDSNADERPEWYDRVKQQLARLNGHWKQATTIMQILLAEVNGVGWDKPDFWGQTNTCARSTFYKWMSDDPQFPSVLRDCRAAVHDWRQEQAAASIDETLLLLKLGGPAAVRQLLRIIESGRSEHAKVSAILGLLDRADLQTAVKQTHAIPANDIDQALQQIYGSTDD